jgi:hypothetical protein
MFEYAGPRNGPASVANAIEAFYEQELQIISRNVERGIAEEYFDAVDADRIAAFVSTHIDGIFYDSFIRSKDDMTSAMNDLKWVLWKLLGYTPKGSDQQPHFALL